MRLKSLYPVLLCGALSVPSVAIANTHDQARPAAASAVTPRAQQRQQRAIQRRVRAMRTTSRVLGSTALRRTALARHLAGRLEINAIVLESPSVVSSEHRHNIVGHVLRDAADIQEGHAAAFESRGQTTTASYLRARANQLRAQASGHAPADAAEPEFRSVGDTLDHVATEADRLGNLAAAAAVEARDSGDVDTARRLAREARAHRDAARRARQMRTLQRHAEAVAGPGGNVQQAVAGFIQDVYDAKHGTSQPGTRVWTTGDPSSSDTTVAAAAAGVQETADFQLAAFGYDVMTSLARLNGHVGSTVHYDRGYNNAFWDSTQMVYGDGDQIIFGTFAGEITVPAHELHHGITEAKAPLTYAGQSGAMNEHRSDWGGLQVKARRYQTSTKDTDWDIGADRRADGGRGASIFMPKIKSGLQGRLASLRRADLPGTGYNDPNVGQDRQPKDMDGYYKGSQDNGGVHINSGIFNRAAYLTATNIDAALGGNTNIYASDSAVLRIWEAGMNTLGPRATFQQGANAIYQAARQMYPNQPEVANAVVSAFATVKMPVSTTVKLLGRSRVSNRLAIGLREQAAERGRERLAQERAQPGAQ